MGQVRAHEARELPGGVHPSGQVEVIGNKAESDELDFMEPLRAAQLSDDYFSRGTWRKGLIAPI
jgi:hypothetical protein